MADRAAAAIRRASQQARNAMRELDARSAEDMIRIYADAADQIEGLIRAAAASGPGQRVELARLRELLAQVESALQGAFDLRDGLLGTNSEIAAHLGVRPFTGQGLAATGRDVPAVLDGRTAAELVDRAVQFVSTFRAADGLVLSDRLWRIDRGAREVLTRTIEQAVVQGWSADRAAQELIMRGQPVDAATQAARGAADAGQVLRAADLLRNEQAAPLADALRVMRTEINRAHGEAYMAGGDLAPGFAGFRFLLSPQHPRPDICDLLASQNLHGLGPGVYPSRRETPWPAHPNTLSFVVVVFASDITDADRAGKESTLQALERLAPELREGVLGPTKAGYFDQGLLTTGMVRATVGATRNRLARQGRI